MISLKLFFVDENKKKMLQKNTMVTRDMNREHIKSPQ